MLKPLLKRVVYACILLGFISVIAFYLSKLVPGDEILDYLSIDESRYSAASDPIEQKEAYTGVAAKRGLNLPLFYFSVRPGYYPDSLYHIVPVEDRETLRHWVQVTKNKNAAVHLHRNLMKGIYQVCPYADTSLIADQSCQTFNNALTTKDLFSMQHQIIRLEEVVAKASQTDPMIADWIQVLKNDLAVLINKPHRLHTSDWLPSFSWHGAESQYHRWLTGFVSFKPVTSLIDGRDAWVKILEALRWTVLLNGLAFLLAISLGMAIGIWSGTHDGSWAERILHIKLFALFALPSFWLATLFIYFFASGEWLSVFPAGGLGRYNTPVNIFTEGGMVLWHLVLPVLCLALGSLAYISRQMKQSVLKQLKQPYVLSLRTLGISEKTILRKHVFRNALFPMITMIGASIPALLSGSLIIEVIFNIPGMGRLMYTSLMARDWPVVFPILMFAATITVLAYILTDIVYKWADPRVKTMES